MKIQDLDMIKKTSDPHLYRGKILLKEGGDVNKFHFHIDIGCKEFGQRYNQPFNTTWPQKIFQVHLPRARFFGLNFHFLAVTCP